MAMGRSPLDIGPSSCSRMTRNKTKSHQGAGARMCWSQYSRRRVGTQKESRSRRSSLRGSPRWFRMRQQKTKILSRRYHSGNSNSTKLRERRTSRTRSGRRRGSRSGSFRRARSPLRCPLDPRRSCPHSNNNKRMEEKEEKESLIMRN